MYTVEAPVRSENRPPVSRLRLIVSLLLAALICGVTVGFAYYSLLLFALLEGVGIPITAGLAVLLLITTEQAAVACLSGWRPPVLLVILAALPATAVAFGLRELLQWNSWFGIAIVVAAGLVIQALVLHSLIARAPQEASDSIK